MISDGDDALPLLNHSYIISYTLNDGSVVTRNYNDPEGFFSTENLFKNYQAILSKKKYVEKYSIMANAEDNDVYCAKVTALDKNDYDQNAEMDSTFDESEICQKNINKIVNALSKDFKADKSNASTVLSEYANNGYFSEIYMYYSSSYNTTDGLKSLTEYEDIVCRIQLSAQTNVYGSSNILGLVESGLYEPSNEVFLVPKTYVNTINALQEIGVLNSDYTINTKGEYFKKYYGFY